MQSNSLLHVKCTSVTEAVARIVAAAFALHALALNITPLICIDVGNATYALSMCTVMHLYAMLVAGVHVFELFVCRAL